MIEAQTIQWRAVLVHSLLVLLGSLFFIITAVAASMVISRMSKLSNCFLVHTLLPRLIAHTSPPAVLPANQLLLTFCLVGAASWQDCGGLATGLDKVQRMVELRGMKPFLDTVGQVVGCRLLLENRLLVRGLEPIVVIFLEHFS